MCLTIFIFKRNTPQLDALGCAAVLLGTKQFIEASRFISPTSMIRPSL
jgi:hypothetical protein